MKALFDKISAAASKNITKTYSTSFSIGIYCLNKKLHDGIYGIYGFVRLADEIVDSFHGYDKAALLEEFREETYKSIDRKISMNPVLNSFQQVVNDYKIDMEALSYPEAFIICNLTTPSASGTEPFVINSLV